MVLNTALDQSYVLAQSPVDGALYASVRDGGTYMVLKSDDGGRTWEIANDDFTSAVIAIVPSDTEAGVVFVATAATFFKSMDGGTTFTTIANAPTGDSITALDVAVFSGHYLAVIGTNNGGSSGIGVYYWDETQPFNNLYPVGTTSFGLPVIALAMAPTFATDRAVVAVGVNTGVSTVVKVNVNGGAWGATVADTVIGSGADATGADIAFPSDFNVMTNPIYFVAITDANDGGLWRLIGNSPTNVDASALTSNVDISGSFNANTANILVGRTDGTVRKSTNAGFSFSAVTLRSSNGATAFVLFDKDYAANKKAYVLNVGGANGAFNVTIDGMSYFNQWSLINDTIGEDFDNDLAIASNGDMFMITNNNNLWRYFGGVWERIAVGIAEDMVRVSPNYATDKAVFLAEESSANALRVSTTNGNKFDAMSSAPGSITGGADAVRSLLVLSNSTVVVGSNAGIITTNTSAYWWVESSPFGANYVVSDIRMAANGELLAAAYNNTTDTIAVAYSTDNGQTWTTLKFANSTAMATFATGGGTTNFALVTPAADYSATNRAVFASGYATGGDTDIFRMTNGVSTAWTALTTNQTDVGYSGLVTMPAAGNADEGTGVVYGIDYDGIGDTLSRIKGNATVDEATNDLGFDHRDQSKIDLWVYNGKLWTINGNGIIMTYTPALDVAAPAVTATAVTPTSFTVSWDAFKVGADTLASILGAGFVDYRVVVNTVAQTNYYTAANGPGIIVNGSNAVTNTAGTSVAVTGLTSNVVYYVSLWVAEDFAVVSGTYPVTSFRASVSVGTPPEIPTWTPHLSPVHGAQGVALTSTFAWDAVPGATSYEFRITEGTTLPTGAWTPVANNFYAPATALKAGTTYTWQVRAISNTGTGAEVTSVFRTADAATPPVTVTQTSPGNITLTVPASETPGYIWIIIGVGGLLTILVIVLIVRTRRVV
ncbi:hypothetical protein DGWBC_1659 [Dehalogenimonas sp. WBC-2]|nr:hypothetical protein DGWBC_1659 [Dehalogenimonas sp. WBC-2]